MLKWLKWAGHHLDDTNNFICNGGSFSSFIPWRIMMHLCLHVQTDEFAVYLRYNLPILLWDNKKIIRCLWLEKYWVTISLENYNWIITWSDMGVYWTKNDGKKLCFRQCNFLVTRVAVNTIEEDWSCFASWTLKKSPCKYETGYRWRFSRWAVMTNIIFTWHCDCQVALVCTFLCRIDIFMMG